MIILINCFTLNFVIQFLSYNYDFRTHVTLSSKENQVDRKDLLHYNFYKKVHHAKDISRFKVRLEYEEFYFIKKNNGNHKTKFSVEVFLAF